jgi:hypothetical protein
MSRLTDLIARAKAKDSALGEELEREFKALASRMRTRTAGWLACTCPMSGSFPNARTGCAIAARPGRQFQVAIQAIGHNLKRLIRLGADPIPLVPA